MAHYLFHFVNSFFLLQTGVAARSTSDLSMWDTSKVIDMIGMFRQAFSFDSDLSSWDVSNVKSMALTFDGAMSFTGDVSGWNVSNVNNHGLYSFGEVAPWLSLGPTNAVGEEPVSHLTDFARTFHGAVQFNRAHTHTNKLQGSPKDGEDHCAQEHDREA